MESPCEHVLNSYILDVYLLSGYSISCMRRACGMYLRIVEWLVENEPIPIKVNYQPLAATKLPESPLWTFLSK